MTRFLVSPTENIINVRAVHTTLCLRYEHFATALHHVTQRAYLPQFQEFPKNVLISLSWNLYRQDTENLRKRAPIKQMTKFDK